MNELSRVEARLTEVEIKLSFAEDLVDQLNEVIVRQQSQIDLLIREVVALRDQAPAAEFGQGRQSADDKPPHY